MRHHDLVYVPPILSSGRSFGENLRRDSLNAAPRLRRRLSPPTPGPPGRLRPAALLRQEAPVEDTMRRLKLARGHAIHADVHDLLPIGAQLRAEEPTLLADAVLYDARLVKTSDAALALNPNAQAYREESKIFSTPSAARSGSAVRHARCMGLATSSSSTLPALVLPKSARSAGWRCSASACAAPSLESAGSASRARRKCLRRSLAGSLVSRSIMLLVLSA